MESALKTIDLLWESLPSDAAVQQVVVGAFWTVVVVKRKTLCCGLASSMRDFSSREGVQVEAAGELHRQSARELARLIYSKNPMEAGIGMAAINALVEVDLKACREINARELILREGKNRNVVVVGHFPFIPAVRDVAANCQVLELHPGPGDLPAERAGEVLPEADVVALTATSLINHTFDHLISLCKPNAFVILLGGSTPLVPLLLDRGITVLAGTVLQDVEAAVRAISQGANFRQIPGRKLITLTRIPNL
ncbi:MAG: DUF364 domain-containing protein [Calditrichia bacterium]